ncbi:hypothetical protein FF100_31620 [Methylobacterium terricola]|uniref:Uncharacterized protein n=1 Tax=Methylobacterium terricola TaxID=2583531 RepID=A0A5C4L9U5_9HYPH|nr:hypothetical protein [Methylobacterium terricola]TNC07633.1 hypothetical protein FF100_31620 [Methylobacterium terricola]
MRDLISYGNVIALLSIVAAGAAIYLALTDSKGAAITMGGLFLSMGIVSQLDRFKSFEAFTIKAQLQDRIDRADELIKQLRTLSLLVAKAGYASTGLTTMSFGAVQASNYNLTKDFDAVLSTLSLTEDELQNVKQPLVKALAYRIWAGFFGVALAIPQYHPSDSSQRNPLSAKDGAALTTLNHNRLLSANNADDLRVLLKMFLPDGMSPQQISAADGYIEKLITLYEGCRKAGGPTPEFIAFEAQALTGAQIAPAAKAIYNGQIPD